MGFSYSEFAKEYKKNNPDRKKEGFSYEEFAKSYKEQSASKAESTSQTQKKNRTKKTVRQPSKKPVSSIAQPETTPELKDLSKSSRYTSGTQNSAMDNLNRTKDSSKTNYKKFAEEYASSKAKADKEIASATAPKEVSRDVFKQDELSDVSRHIKTAAKDKEYEGVYNALENMEDEDLRAFASTANKINQGKELDEKEKAQKGYIAKKYNLSESQINTVARQTMSNERYNPYFKRYQSFSADKNAVELLDIINEEEKAREDAGIATISQLLGGEKGAASASLERTIATEKANDARKKLKAMGYDDDDIKYFSNYRQRETNAELAKATTELTKKMTRENPALASTVSVITNLASPIGLVEVAKSKIEGVPIDPNSRFFSPTQLTSDIRGEVQSNYDWNIDVNKDGESWDAFDFVYGAGMSTVDSLVAGAISPKLGLTPKSAKWFAKSLVNTANNLVGGSVIGSQAMTSTIQDVAKRNGTTEQAVKSGVVSFLAETLSEAWSIGNFKVLQESGKRGLANFIMDLFKSSGVNLTEEVATEAVNLAYDRYLMGEKSNYELNVRAYMQEQKPDGTYYTRAEAESLAFQDDLKQIGEAGLSGAFQGLIMGGTANTTNRISRNAQDRALGKKIKQQGLTGAVVEAARTSKDELAQEYVKSINRKGTDKASNAAVGAVARELLKGGETTESALETVESYSRPINLSSTEKVQITHPTLGKADGKVVSLSSVESVNNGNITVKNSNGETQTLDLNKLGSKAKALWSYAAETFTDPKVIEGFVDNYEGGSVETYSDSFKDVFSLASVGMTAEQIKKEGFFGYRTLGQKAFESAVELGNNAMSYKEGVVDLTTNRKTTSQKLIMNMANEFGKRHGMNITFVDSLGSREGFLNPKSNQIVIALNGSRGAIARTLGHETYHYVEQQSDVQAGQISDFVIDTLTNIKGKEWVESRYAFYEKQGYKTLDEQKSELVADQMFEVFANERAVNEFVAKDRNLAQRVLDHIKGLIAEIKNIYKKLVASGNYDDIAAWQEDLKALEKVNDMMLDALANIEQRKNLEKQTDEQVLEDNGYIIDETGAVINSIRRDNDMEGEITTEELAQRMSNATGNSVEECIKYIQDTKSISARYYADVFEGEGLLDYDVDDNYTAIKQNSDYPQGSVDFNTNCPKRRDLTEIYDTLQQKYPNHTFTADELAYLRQLIAEEQLEVACGCCFVEDRRQKLGEIAQEYIRMYNSALDSENGQLVKRGAKGKQIPMFITQTIENMFGDTLGVKQGEPLIITDKYVPTHYDLGTYEGFRALRKNHPQVAMGYIAYNNSRGQQAGRLIEGNAEYKRQILEWSQSKVDKANSVGGLRIFSFSDFVAVHALDLIQIVQDASAVGLKIQGYTKINSFARMIKDTGIKLNRSLIPTATGIKVVDGKKVLAFNTRDGIDPNSEDFFDSSDNPNVGNVLIGVSEEQIRLAMESDLVDYIIPFHSNQARRLLEWKNVPRSWKNYKSVQLEKDATTKKNTKNSVNIYTDVIDKYGVQNEKQFVESFLQECKERNLIPRFSELLNKDADGNFVYTEGYYKLLLDFKLFDKQGNILPQNVVVPKFDSKFINQMLDDYTKGEATRKANSPKRDAVVDKFSEKLESGEIKQIVAQNIKDFRAKKSVLPSVFANPYFETTSLKFSMSREVETTNDLVAVHNISEEQLIDVLKRGNLIAPSLAVTNLGHTGFADLSLVFDKNTIDPKANKENKLFGADAWTPTQTTLKKGARFDSNKVSQTVDSIKSIIGSRYSDELFNLNTKQFKDAVIKADGSVYSAFSENLGMQTAYAIEKGYIDRVPVKQGVVDKTALKEQLDSKLHSDYNWREYKQWLNGISDSVIESYNTATNEDILNNMKSQPLTAKPFKLMENGELVVPATEYSGIEDLRSNKHRLSKSAEAETKKVASKLMSFAKNLGKAKGVSTKDVINAINNAFESRYNTKDIVNAFSTSGVSISNGIAKDLQSLYKQAVELPAPYFEAKPLREVGLNEVVTAIIPDTASAELKAMLEENNISYQEYESNNDESRIKALNSVDEVKFSTKRDADYMTAVESGDMKTAQEMVDKKAETAMPNSVIRNSDGTLLKVYHGSPNKFTVFNPNKLNTNGNAHGRGFYFTEEKSLAEGYSKESGQLLSGYLNITNPMSEDKVTIKKNDLVKLIKATCEAEAKSMVDDGGYDNVSDALFDTWVSNYVYTYGMDMSRVYREVADIVYNNDSDVQIIAEMTNIAGAENVLNNVYKITGYDGVIYENDRGTHEFVALTSNQFKSADPVTYDDDGNVIPLSQRFDESKDDIRFATSRLTNYSPLSYNDRAKPNPRSSINWVYEAELFSVVENKLFHQKISEINQGSKAFKKNADGEYMLPIENKIVFTNGDYGYPEITKIIEFMSESQTSVVNARKVIYSVEKGESSYETSRRALENLYGQGFVYEYHSEDNRPYEWKGRVPKGRNRKAIIKRYIQMQNGAGNTSSGNTNQGIIPSTKREIGYGKLTQERINELISDSGAGSRVDYARSWIAEISPSAFIDLTIPFEQRLEDREYFDEKVQGDHGNIMGDRDYIEDLKNSRMMPRLSVDIDTGKVIGHDGRHRMRALEIAGASKTPIEIVFYKDDTMYKGNNNGERLESIEFKRLTSQFDEESYRQYKAYIDRIIPLNEDHRVEIERAYKIKPFDEKYGNAIAYSTKRESSVSEDASDYILDTKEYQDILKIVDQRYNLTNKKNLSPKAIERLAGKLLSNSKSKYDKGALTERVGALFDYMANSNELVWEDVMKTAAEISHDILSQSSSLDRSMQNQYKDTLDYLKGLTVYISPEVRAEIDSRYGSLENYRRMLGGKTKITVTDSSRMSLDSLWKELNEYHPEMFDADVSSFDQAEELVNFFEMTKPTYVNQYEYYWDMNEASYDFALQIYEEYFNIPEVQTESQRHKLEMERLKGKQNAKIAQIRKEYKDRIKRIRVEKNSKIEATKELYRERNRQYREKRNDTAERQKLRRQIVRETKKLTDKLVNPTDQKHIPQELIVGINSFAKAMTEHGAFPAQRASALQEAFKNIGEKATDPDFNIASMYEEEIDAMLGKLASVLSDKRLGEMTSAELSEVRDIAQYFSHIVSMSNQAFSDGIKEKLSELQTSAFDEVASQSKDKKRMMFKMQTGLLKPVTFFEILESPTLEKLYTNIRKGEESWARVVLGAKQKRIATQEKYEYKKWADDKVDITTERGDKLSISVKEALSIYATSKRKQGVEHIMVGGIVLEEEARKQLDKKNRFSKNKDKSVNVRSANVPLSLADIQNINSLLTGEQKAYADELVRYMSSDMAKLGNEVSTKLYGIQKYNEDYYFPLKSANNFLYSEPGVENDSRIKHMSMTKRTKPKASNPVVIGDFTETVMSHCNDMALYYGFTLPLEDFKRVWNYNTPIVEGVTPSGIKQKIDMVYGDKANKYIKQMLTDINGGVTKQAGADVVNRMISLAKKNAVFASLSVAVQQPSAIARSLAYIDPKYFVGHQKKGTWEEIKKYAPVAIVKEMGYFDTGIGKQAVEWMTETEYEGLKEKAFAFFKDKNYRDDMLSLLPSYMDEITWGRIWVAVKNETKAKHPDLDVNSDKFLNLAGERFTYVIDRTQVYDSVFSRSEWMRSKDTGMKVATAFMSEPLTNYNMLYNAAIKAKNGDKKFAARALGAYVVSVVLNSALKSFVIAARSDDDDEYWYKYLSAFLDSILDEPLGMIPYFKDLFSLLQGYDSNRMDTQVLADIANAVETLRSKKKSPYEKVKSVAGAVGIATGVPLKNLWREVEMLLRIFGFDINSLKK